MAVKLLVKYRTKKLKSPEEIQDFSFVDLQRIFDVSLPFY